jgi:hypothetical protein
MAGHVESIHELQRRTPFRPGKPGKASDVIDSGFSRLLRHVEGYIGQDHLLESQRRFPLLRDGSEVFNHARPLKPRAALPFLQNTPGEILRFAQNDSVEAFIRSLFSPAVTRPS